MFCTVHDMMPELMPETFRMHSGKRIARQKRVSVKRAAAVLCVSENTKQDVVRVLGVPEAKCRVVHNGVADAFFEDLHASEPVVPGAYLLYVGGYRIPYKNFSLLRDALGAADASRLRGYRLVVAGPEKPDAGDVSKCEGLLGAGRVEFVSDCDDNKLARLYTGCAAFVMPSLYEGFGIPVAEALACGAPVACSDAASLPEVGGAVVHYLDPTSAMSITLAVDAALAEGRSQTEVEKRKKWAARFSWDKAAEQFCAVVRELAGKQ